MYPQTHVYFAERVLGKINDALTLGSIFPDMAIGAGLDRDQSHGSGLEMLQFFKSGDRSLIDFALGNLTHGVKPGGLDYYGDESNPPYERGYCFEKGRSLVDATVRACNIPPEMGWWKSHNIVEMGIEVRIGSGGVYGRRLHDAFQNRRLVEDICEQVGAFYGRDTLPLLKRMLNFPSYIDLSVTTAESLAAKYDYQMYYKHRIRVDIPGVARLIKAASEMVEDDIDDFFASVVEKVKGLIDRVD